MLWLSSMERINKILNLPDPTTKPFNSEGIMVIYEGSMSSVGWCRNYKSYYVYPNIITSASGTALINLLYEDDIACLSSFCKTLLNI